MKTVAVIVSLLSLASASAAAAATAQATDADYVHASRCRGLATGLGVDASALNAYVKAQGLSRNPIVQEHADEEFARAKREARGDAKERLQAELSGPCAAYVASTKALATR